MSATVWSVTVVSASPITRSCRSDGIVPSGARYMQQAGTAQRLPQRNTCGSDACSVNGSSAAPAAPQRRNATGPGRICREPCGIKACTREAMGPAIRFELMAPTSPKGFDGVICSCGSS